MILSLSKVSDMIPRRRTITFSRIFFVVGALVLFCIFTLLIGNATPPSEDTYPLTKLNLNTSDAISFHFSTINQVNSTLIPSFHTTENGSISSNLFEPLPAYENVLNSIDYLNFHHDVLNEDRFGSANTSAFVIVVQVHSRIEYLKYLIDALKNAVGIEDALLVFSHDLHNDDINAVIKAIDFCRVIQIFYPTNIQVFANVFPGTDPRDCLPMAKASEANESKCLGYDHPDKYGHYRTASLTQIKHHWWWKMNYVYDGIMKRYGFAKSYAVLLEEDHYVSPDFVYVLKDLIQNKDAYCPTCQVLSLGFYLKNYNKYQADINKIAIHPWFTSKHNMAMAFNGDTWEEIRACAKTFCTFDDYNWDWSLLQISVHCLSKRLKVLVAKAPRVLHVGDCGVHTHRCKVHNAASNAKALFTRVASSLFPAHLKVSEISSRTLKPSKANGGWGDLRDQNLCLANTAPFKPPSQSIDVLNVSAAELFEPPSPSF